MLLSVVLSYLHRPGRYRTSTGRGNKASSCLYPASRDRPLTKVSLGGTAVRHPVKAWPREGEAAGFSHRKTKVPLMERPPSGLSCKLWDRDSFWSLSQPRVCVCVCACVDSLTARGSRTTLLCRPAEWPVSVSQYTLKVPCTHTHRQAHRHTHTHTHSTVTAPLHVLCSAVSRGVIIPVCPLKFPAGCPSRDLRHIHSSPV